VGWHTHDDHFTFMDTHGYRIRLDYLDLLTGLAEGRVLVCERQVEDQTVDRWLVHNEYNNEFDCLQADERIIVRRATTQAAEATRTSPLRKQ
jgi:hypothetical protein